MRTAMYGDFLFSYLLIDLIGGWDLIAGMHPTLNSMPLSISGD